MQPVLALAPFTAPVTEATSDTPPAVAGAFLASVEEEQVLPDPAAGPLVNWLPSVPVVAPFVVEATKMVADVGFPPDFVEREAASLAAVQGDLAVQPDAGIAAEPLVVALTKESSANPQAENRVQVPHRHAEASKKVSTPEPSEQALLSRSAVASAVMGVLVPTAEDASQAAVSGPGMAGQVVPDRVPSGAGIDTPVARAAIHAEVPEMPGATKVAPVRSEVAGPWPALVDPQIEPMAAVTETSVGSNTDAVTMAEPIEPPQIPAKQVIQSAATQPAAVPLHPSGPKAAASMVVSEPDRAEAVAAKTESVALEDAAALPLPASDGSGDKRPVLPVVIGFWERVFSALAIPATSLPELEVRKSLPLVSTGPAELPAGTSQLAKDGGITLTTTPAVPLVPIAPQDDQVTIQPDEAVIVPAPAEAEPTSRKTTLVLPLQMPAPPSLLAGPTVVAVTDADPEGQLDEGFSMMGAPATGPGPAPVVYGSPAAHQSSPQLPVPQVATQIVTALSHADGATELALSPEELGHVRLRLEPDAANPDRMVVMITFERPETLDLFRRHAGDLAEALRSAGYAGADIGFGQGGTGSNGFDKAPGRGSADDRSDVGPPVSPPPRHTVGASLDLRL